MVTNFLVVGKSLSSISTSHLANIIQSCAAACSLSLHQVRSFVVADEEGYGDSIRSLSDDGKEHFTNSELFLGVGKTIAHRPGANGVESSIVIRDSILAGILIGLQTGKPVESWEIPSQQSLYTICHELGHAKDNFARNITFAPRFDGSEFSPKIIGNYYKDILLSEFSASAHGGKVVTTELLADFVAAAVNTVKDILEEIRAKRRILETYGDGESLRDLAFAMTQGNWVILVEYAKLVGLMTSVAPQNISGFRLFELGSIECPKETELKFLSALNNFWVSYPSIGQDDLEILDEVFLSFSLAQGFIIKETDEGAGVWLCGES